MKVKMGGRKMAGKKRGKKEKEEEKRKREGKKAGGERLCCESKLCLQQGRGQRVVTLKRPGRKNPDTSPVY